jgi:hypothetical protein
MAKKAAKRKASGSGRKTSPAAARKAAPRKAARPAARKSAAKAPPRAAKAPRKTAPKRAVTRPAARKAAPVRRAGAAAKASKTKTAAKKPAAVRRPAAAPQADALAARRAPGLNRARRQLREVADNVPTPPSSLDPDLMLPSAARSGRKGLRDDRLEHNEVSPEITAGDVDADWEDAYASGDEAPGGDNPTPDQDRVDDIGKALGVQYEDNEELKGADKIAKRDRNRWELDPASSEDYVERDHDLD